MADEHGPLEPELAYDVYEVVGIPVQACVLGRIVGGKLGAACAHMVEQHGAEPRLESRGHETPHVLVAAEAVGEDHGAVASAVHMHVIAFDRRHSRSPGR